MSQTIRSVLIEYIAQNVIIFWDILVHFRYLVKGTLTSWYRPQQPRHLLRIYGKNQYDSVV